MGAVRIIILLVAAGAAGITLLLMRSFLTDAGSHAEAQPAINMPITQVLVATKDMARGTRVAPGDLSWQAWPESAVSASYFEHERNPNALPNFENAIVRVDMSQGEPVTASKVVRLEGAGFMAAIIEKGKRAVSTEISPETGAGGFILPNDHVDVIVAERKGSSNGRDLVLTRTILENVKVLAIDQTIRQSEQGDQVVVGSTATLELDPGQAEQLTLAKTVGELSLSLRSLADSGENADPDQDRRVSNLRMYQYGVESN